MNLQQAYYEQKFENAFLRAKGNSHSAPALSYDGFVLALDFLFLLAALEVGDGFLALK